MDEGSGNSYLSLFGWLNVRGHGDRILKCSYALNGYSDDVTGLKGKRVIGDNSGSGHQKGPVRKIVFPKKERSQFLVTALQLGESSYSTKYFLLIS